MGDRAHSGTCSWRELVCHTDGTQLGKPLLPQAPARASCPSPRGLEVVAGWPVYLEPHGTHWASTDWNSQAPGESHIALQGHAGLHGRTGGGDHPCHIPTPVYFCRHCCTVLAAWLIVDSYGAGVGAVVSKTPGPELGQKVGEENGGGGVGEGVL